MPPLNLKYRYLLTLTFRPLSLPPLLQGYSIVTNLLQGPRNIQRRDIISSIIINLTNIGIGVMWSSLNVKCRS